MAYNFIRKIKQKEFSLYEDSLQTAKDLYKSVGLEFLVKQSEKKLGPLRENDGLLVETAYATSLYCLGSGIYPGGTDLGIGIIASIGLIGLGVKHHQAMRIKE